MFDAHCHCFAATPYRKAVCAARLADFDRFDAVGPDDDRYYGVHPWHADEWCPAAAERLRAALEAHPAAGVGEIGLDRLKSKTISAAQRAAFEAQLAIAAELHRPVQLHGAKCWGEVVACVKPFAAELPAILFHGFSRSGGLLPDIVAMGGRISVGKALLNDHAVHYRELVARIPADRLVLETDGDAPDADLLARLARAMAADKRQAQL